VSVPRAKTSAAPGSIVVTQMAYHRLRVRRLTPADYPRMPWRNGGGTTTELVIEPAGAGLAAERFLYRVSIADVASSGPFSRFAGYDRHIMLLEGAGMTLDCGVHGRIELGAPLEPRSFSGDWEVEGALVAGAVRDFNVIVDRARASAILEVRSLEAARAAAPGISAEPGGMCVVHVIAGALVNAAAGDTLVAEGTHEDPLDLVPVGAARVAIVRVTPRR
jgi:environmental stress-induced protein Ves